MLSRLLSSCLRPPEFKRQLPQAPNTDDRVLPPAAAASSSGAAHASDPGQVLTSPPSPVAAVPPPPPPAPRNSGEPPSPSTPDALSSNAAVNLPEQLDEPKPLARDEPEPHLPPPSRDAHVHEANDGPSDPDGPQGHSNSGSGYHETARRQIARRPAGRHAHAMPGHRPQLQSVSRPPSGRRGTALDLRQGSGSGVVATAGAAADEQGGTSDSEADSVGELPQRMPPLRRVHFAQRGRSPHTTNRALLTRRCTPLGMRLFVTGPMLPYESGPNSLDSGGGGGGGGAAHAPAGGAAGASSSFAAAAAGAAALAQDREAGPAPLAGARLAAAVPCGGGGGVSGGGGGGAWGLHPRVLLAASPTSLEAAAAAADAQSTSDAFGRSVARTPTALAPADQAPAPRARGGRQARFAASPPAAASPTPIAPAAATTAASPGGGNRARSAAGPVTSTRSAGSAAAASPRRRPARAASPRAASPHAARMRLLTRRPTPCAFKWPHTDDGSSGPPRSHDDASGESQAGFIPDAATASGPQELAGGFAAASAPHAESSARAAVAAGSGQERRAWRRQGSRPSSLRLNRTRARPLYSGGGATSSGPGSGSGAPTISQRALRAIPSLNKHARRVSSSSLLGFGTGASDVSGGGLGLPAGGLRDADLAGSAAAGGGISVGGGDGRAGAVAAWPVHNLRPRARSFRPLSPGTGPAASPAQPAGDATDALADPADAQAHTGPTLGVAAYGAEDSPAESALGGGGQGYGGGAWLLQLHGGRTTPTRGGRRRMITSTVDLGVGEFLASLSRNTALAHRNPVADPTSNAAMAHDAGTWGIASIQPLSLPPSHDSRPHSTGTLGSAPQPSYGPSPPHAPQRRPHGVRHLHVTIADDLHSHVVHQYGAQLVSPDSGDISPDWRRVSPPTSADAAHLAAALTSPAGPAYGTGPGAVQLTAHDTRPDAFWPAAVQQHSPAVLLQMLMPSSAGDTGSGAADGMSATNSGGTNQRRTLAGSAAVDEHAAASAAASAANSAAGAAGSMSVARLGIATVAAGSAAAGGTSSSDPSTGSAAEAAARAEGFGTLAEVGVGAVATRGGVVGLSGVGWGWGGSLRRSPSLAAYKPSAPAAPMPASGTVVGGGGSLAAAAAAAGGGAGSHLHVLMRPPASTDSETDLAAAAAARGIASSNSVGGWHMRTRRTRHSSSGGGGPTPPSPAPAAAATAAASAIASVGPGGAILRAGIHGYSRLRLLTRPASFGDIASVSPPPPPPPPLPQPPLAGDASGAESAGTGSVGAAASRDTAAVSTGGGAVAGEGRDAAATGRKRVPRNPSRGLLASPSSPSARRALRHAGSPRSHAPTEDDSAESLAKLDLTKLEDGSRRGSELGDSRCGSPSAMGPAAAGGESGPGGKRGEAWEGLTRAATAAATATAGWGGGAGGAKRSDLKEWGLVLQGESEGEGGEA